jgi:hypothetical protein
MPLMLSRRRLEPGDFENWKTRFESGAAERKAAGCRGVRRFRGIEDRDELVMIFDWDTIENGRAFVQKKVTQVRQLSEMRADGTPKHDYMFVEEMEPLPS